MTIISFSDILYSVLIQPLQIVFEIIYGMAFDIYNSHVLSILALSVAMNFLVLPLYRRADAMQDEERKTEAKLSAGVEHIKNTFKGDEKMMMLQTYYRQNNYKPIYALKGATSLLLQIPFFIAAYNFLSHLSSLKGVKMGMIQDLGAPDHLITVFGLSINLLPFVMTAVNFISSAIYSKQFDKKSKIQLYLTAAVFLVLLYNSPSGLVFYWTLNNVFSLIKTIVFKTKKKKKTSCILLSVVGIVLFLLILLLKNRINELAFLVTAFIAFVLEIPLIVYYLLGKSKTKKPLSTVFGRKLRKTEPNRKIFIIGTLFLTVVTGAVIPSNIIKSSPTEFVFPNMYRSPLVYILSSVCIAVGTFIVWFGIFYWLMSDKYKPLFEIIVCILCGSSLINYMVFDNLFGTLKASLYYIKGIYSSSGKIIVDLLLIVVVTVIIIIVFLNRPKVLASLLLVSVIAFSGLSAVNASYIYKNSSRKVIETAYGNNDDFKIKLSKNGKNVVVLMIDRAMGVFFPYIINEKPELMKMFSGFTYYSNVISYGRTTNFGISPLFGGYEYTPIEMNTRKDESLCKKHNEALRIMPIIFGNNGYDVTFVNPTYANYRFVADLSLFDEYPYVSAYNIDELSTNDDIKRLLMKNNDRNFFIHSIMRISPLLVQPVIYNDGMYYESNSFQEPVNEHKARGNNVDFLQAYSVLSNMPMVTEVTENKNELFIMSNNTTHDIQLLKEPEYVPAENVDNTLYDEQNKERFNINGRELKMNNFVNYSHYQSNVAALIQLGKWFDYLKQLGVYDNTRIIVVADHGYGVDMNLLDELIIDKEIPPGIGDAETYFPLLLVKDFNSSGEIKTSDEFMTNADVPTLAFSNLIKNPTNPFTGKAINNSEKTAHDQYIIASYDFDIAKNNGNQYLPAIWFSVHDSIWEHKNWKCVSKKATLTKEDLE